MSAAELWTETRHLLHIRPRERCARCYSLRLAYLVIERDVEHNLAMLAVAMWEADDVPALEALEEHTR